MSENNFPFIEKGTRGISHSAANNDKDKLPSNICNEYHPNYPNCIVGLTELTIANNTPTIRSFLQIVLLAITSICITGATVLFFTGQKVKQVAMEKNSDLKELMQGELLDSLRESEVASSKKLQEEEALSKLQEAEPFTILENESDSIKATRISSSSIPDHASSLQSKFSEVITDFEEEENFTFSTHTTHIKGLRSLIVSDKILGYGSHGTVVFQGKFQDRPVAIKRLLSDFFNVADHEVKLLQESDDHPNICRFFHKEYCDGFMYIALELCSATLFDVIQNSSIENTEITRQLPIKDMLLQLMRGVDHLHSLNIVHRDIKPQNILILASKPKPRVVISDFGLGKRLADDQSSFNYTAVTGGGSFGYRAPELLLSFEENQKPIGFADVKETPQYSVRITRSIDIFSCGCTYYFALTRGDHPFGERMAREINIIKGNYRLHHLDSHGDQGALAKDLIKKMIIRNNSKRFAFSNLRLSSKRVLEHPYFWTPYRRLTFLQDVSDRLEAESRELPGASPLLSQLEKNGFKIIGADWTKKISRTVRDELLSHRNYETNLIQDLLRAMRNKKHHYHELSNAVKKEIGGNPGNVSFLFQLIFSHFFWKSIQIYSCTYICLFVQILKQMIKYLVLISKKKTICHSFPRYVY